MLTHTNKKKQGIDRKNADGTRKNVKQPSPGDAKTKK